MRIYAAMALLMCGLAISLAACGGSDSTADASGKTSTGAGQEGSSTISKAELISQADAICRKTDAVQKRAYKSYEKLNSDDLSTPEGAEKAIELTALPPLKVEIREVRGLGIPEGDRSRVESIIEGWEEALKTSEGDPGIFLKASEGEGPFTKPDQLAGAYGFKDCSKAL